jgi:RND superfamily putative drug exporter
MLERVAHFSYRRRRAVLASWVVLLVGVSILAGSFGGKTSMQFKLPSSDSQKAFDLLKAAGTGAQNEAGKIVFAAKDLNDPAVVAQANELIAAVSKVKHVARIASPFDPSNPVAARQISKDHTVAFANLTFDAQFQDLPKTIGDKVQDAAKPHVGHGLRVEFGGNEFQSREIGGASEMVGIVAAIVILLFAFGSVLAMGLPILMALFGIGIGLGFVTLLANVVSVPDFASQLAAMIGIGVGIDYALFIVTRYRQLLHDGLDPEAAVVKSVKTAGKAVLFAGCTVVISLLGMFLMGLSFVNGLAIGAALAVLVTMLASVTLLPAVLGFVGRKIDSLALPWAKKTTTSDRNVWYRWSRFVQKYPVPMVVLGLVILGGLAIPVFSIQLGNSDQGNLPEKETARQAYDLLSKGFGPGFNGQMIIAVKVPDDAAGAKLGALADAVAHTKGVAESSPAIWQPGQKVAMVQLFPTTSPQDAKTVDTIDRLRDHTLPAVTKGTGLEAHVGGATALFEDVATILGERLFLFIGGVLAVSFLLLLAVFRSIFVPLKAVVVNLLSIGASYGLLVLIFQKGVGASLIGVGKEGPIESFVPMMMFAIIFGLSMDYEVFLLSRIKEEYDRHRRNDVAVADGLSHTARVITAAAAIMVCVFGSFILGDNRIIKEFGFGLAIAVLIDATVVRMILVPATMELLGDANWWFPKWLERFVPNIHIEGEPDAPVVGTPERPDEPDDELVGAGAPS